MRKRLAVVLLLSTLLPAVRASGAEEGTRPPAVDVFTGASLWNEEGQHMGGSVSVGLFPFRSVGFVADVGFYPPDMESAMVGVRFRYTGQQRVRPFFQILLGRTPLQDTSLQPGFGVEWSVSRRVSARVAGDVSWVGDDGGADIGVRLSAGLVVGFGKR